MLASLMVTLTTELSSRYWPRLPIATPLPPCTVIYVEDIMLAAWEFGICRLMETYILNENVVRSRFDCDSVISALVDKVC